MRKNSMIFRSIAASVVPGVLDTSNARKTELSRLRSEELALLRIPRRTAAQSACLCLLQESIKKLEKELGIPQRKPTITMRGSTPLTSPLNKHTGAGKPEGAAHSAPYPSSTLALQEKHPLRSMRRSLHAYYREIGISQEVLGKYIRLISAESIPTKMLLAPAIQEAVKRGFSDEFILNFINSGPRFSESYQYLNYLTLCGIEGAGALDLHEQMKIMHAFHKLATEAEMVSRLHSHRRN